jgi:hypothetical protein
MNAIQMVIDERKRQDAKWGEQNHDAGTWALIILEELGEWAKEELEKKFGNNKSENDLTELTQVAAVAVAMIENKIRDIHKE